MVELFQYRTWALDAAYFTRMLPLVTEAIMRGHSLVKKQTIQDYIPRIEALLAPVDPETDAIVVMESFSGERIFPVVKSGAQNIALIPIVGPLTKYGEACSYGMQDYQRMLNAAMKDESINGVVLMMDTPGGTVDGTPEFGTAIRNAAKPVGVFADGTLASAGVWLASQASIIVANKNNPTDIGSIGVLTVNEDVSNMVEAGRLPKMTIVRAPGSEEKALINPVEPVTDAAMQAQLADLKNVRDEFVATVKAGRGDKLDVKTEGLFSGRMFSAQAAKAAGLIDSVGTLSTAVNKVAELARTRKKQMAQSATGATTYMFKSNLLSKLFGSSEKAEEQKPEAESLQAADTQAVALEAELQQLSSVNVDLREQLAASQVSITDLQGQVTALKAENKQLADQLAAAQLTTVISDEELEARRANDTAAAKKKFRTAADDEADRYVNALYPQSK